MNQVTIPFKMAEVIPTYEINKLTDELLLNFKDSGKKISPKSQHILSEILDFVAEAEQTIEQQHQLIKKLEVMTATDPITGLLNRRGIIQVLEHAIAAADRHQEPAVFAYIDLDGFKQINDSYGHAVGDMMLKHVANSLVSSIRQTDYAARMGGDEFAILLTHSDLEGGKSRVRFIQQKLNFAKFKYKRNIIPIRASFGLADISEGNKISSIMKQADKQMYRNKSIRKEG